MVRRRSAWSTSLDRAAGVTTKSSAARLRAELGHAPARVLARSLLPVGLNWDWATRFAVGPAADQEQVRADLAHRGAVRRRDAIVRAGGSGLATASAAPRSGPGGSTFGRSLAPRVPCVTRGSARGLGRADTDRAETNVVPQPLSSKDGANRREPAHAGAGSRFHAASVLSQFCVAS